MYWINVIICLIISSTCARSPPFSKIDRRPNHLIGGRDPEHGEVKYIVVVKDGHGLCGGGIIGERHIITAAHCLEIDERSGELRYPIQIVGGTRVASGYAKNAVIERDVTKAYLPGPFVKDGGYNDIAVLELSRPLDLLINRNQLQALHLPEPLQRDPVVYPTYESATVKFAGYGDTQSRTFRNSRTGELETKSWGAGPLKVAKATIDNAETCNIIARDRPDQICLSVNEDEWRVRQQGTCSGDSGGPAVYDNNTVIGVTSMGAYCDNNKVPSLFSRVSYYIPFIKQAMDGRSDGLLVYRAPTNDAKY